MESQIENAVQLAFASQDHEIKRQAIEFLDQVKGSPDGWQVCLSFLSRQPPVEPVVRIYAIDVVNYAVLQKLHEGDGQTLLFVKDTLMGYVRQACYPGSGIEDSYAVRNKVVQTLTSLFTGMYTTSWTTFFDDLLSLTANPGSDKVGENQTGSAYLLSTMENIHNEIADTIMARSQEQNKRGAMLKDAIRARDAPRLMEAVINIATLAREIEKLEIVDAAMDVLGSWVSWVDISIVVTEKFLNLLYGLIGSGEQMAQKALHTLYFVIGKKMKPMEKLQLISVLRLEAIVSQVVASLEDNQDEDIWENLSEVLNVVGNDIVKIFDSDADEAKAPAEALLEGFFSTMLRCFKNEYDEVTRPIIPFFTDLLSFFRKEKRNNSLPQQHALMLQPILAAIIEKMKYADDTDWSHQDEDTEEAEFQDLRKNLKVLQEHISIIDEPMFLQFLTSLVTNTFQRFKEGGQGIEWRDIELALVEIYYMGEMATKTTGMFAKGKPVNEFAEALVLMMRELMSSNIFASVHPAIQIKYVELLVRYVTFFEVHPEFIGQALEDYISAIHSSHTRVRVRSWYLFHRFIRGTRNCVTDVNTVERLLGAISDLLVVKAQVVDADWSADKSDDSRDDATFDSQLSLFEAVGYLASVSCVPPEKQVLYANTVTNPIFADMETHLGPAKNGDKLSIMQIHHDIMALATLARGFSDWVPGAKQTSKQPEAIVVDAFEKAAEAILVSLESLSEIHLIREAARSSFARLIGVMGARILQYVPRWFEALSRTNSQSEIGMFLRLLVQVLHAFRTEIEPVLTGILPGLLGKVLAGLTAPITGTDDAIQTTELKREYINFLLNVFNNDLADVFVNGGNQPFLEEVIKSVELYARDNSDPASQKTALLLLSTMSTVWGPNQHPGMQTATPGSPPAVVSVGSSKGPRHHRPLPGFDRFMMEHFSTLCWEIPADERFKLKDAQSKQALNEVAGLQQVIYKSIGDEFIAYLRNIYFPQISMPQDKAEQYLNALVSLDQKNFRSFFGQFVAQLRNAPD